MLNVSIAGGAGAKAIAEVTDAADIEAAVGPTAEIATGGAVFVQARTLGTGGNAASADATGGAGGVISAGVVFSQATVGAGVRAAFDGNVTSAAGVTVEADGHNLADADTRVTAIGGLTVSASGAEARVGSTGDVEATLGSGASIATSGQLLVSATSDNRALAFSDAGTGGLGAITVTQPDATVAAGTLASLDGKVTSATAVTVEADATNEARRRSEVVSVGIVLRARVHRRLRTSPPASRSRGLDRIVGGHRVPGAAITVHADAANRADRPLGERLRRRHLGRVANPAATNDAQTRCRAAREVGRRSLSINVVAQADDSANAKRAEQLRRPVQDRQHDVLGERRIRVETTLGGTGSVIVATNDIAAKSLATTDADSSSRSTRRRRHQHQQVHLEREHVADA